MAKVRPLSGGATREPKGSEGYTIGVLGKALDLLDALDAHQPLTLTELGTRARVNKVTAFRILANLEERGYVERDAATGQYRLGYRLLQLGARLMESLDLRTVARPILARLQAEFDESVNLALPRGDRILYIDFLQSAQGLRMNTVVGSEDDYHSTALGKAMLAGWPPERLADLLSRVALVRKTPNTIVEPEALRREVERTRARGYALDNEENDVGARCIGAPILDHGGQVIAAISVSGPASRLGPERIPAVAAGVIAAAGEISQQMGHRAPVGAPARHGTRGVAD